MREPAARQAAEQMTRVTDCILFSSSPSDFTEPTHINVHPTIYWLNLFAELGFYPDLVLDATFVSPHSFVLTRRDQPLGEDVRILFAETVRIRQHRAAFLNRHTQVEQLTREVASLERQLREAARNIKELSLKEEDFTRQHELHVAERRKWDETQSELGLTRISLDEAAADLALAKEEAGRLEGFVASQKLALSTTQSTLAQYKNQCTQLESALKFLSEHNDGLTASLNSVYGSPGWQLILRYRNWLDASRARRPWLRKHFEPIALWILRRMKVAEGRATLPIALSSEKAPSENPSTFGLGPSISDSPTTLDNEADDYRAWISENEPDGVQLEIQRRLSATFAYRPIISVVVPVHRIPLTVLSEMIDSVIRQTYDNWELCVAVADRENLDSVGLLERLAAKDSRVKVKVLPKNEGISGNSNRALALATGEYLALLDHDDTLAPFALFEVVQLLNQDRSANFIYSDKDWITEDGQNRFNPLFKPEWSPEVMLNANYLTHLSVMRTDHVREIGGWRSETDGAQDWDLFVRIIRRFGNVRHIPKVLYHWRQISTSVASGGLEVKPYAAEGQVRAVQDYCDSLKIDAKVVRTPQSDLRIQWSPRQVSKVSIIFISKAPSGVALPNVEELRQRFEVIVADAQPSGTDQMVHSTLADEIARATKSASGDIFVFLDDSVSPVEPDWLDEVTGPLQTTEIGLVGARLVDADSRTLRHAGIVFTKEGRLEYIYAWHPEHAYEQAGGAGWYRNWSAVSGACFAIRRDVWEAVDGFSGDLYYPRLDVHLCLKIRLLTGHRILYNPYARLIQRGQAALEIMLAVDGCKPVDQIRACLPAGDPYFSPNLDCLNGKLRFRKNSSNGQSSGYAAESQALVDIYDFSPAQIRQSARVMSSAGQGRLASVTWFLPDFENPFYGGVHTVLRFAAEFLRAHKVRSHFCVLGRAPESRIKEQIAAAFPELAHGSRVFARNGLGRVNDLPPTDAAVCTLWTTAYAALEFDNTKRKFYFIQDDEPMFYPAGSTSALAESTYGFGFYGICNTPSLLRRYIARGGEGEYFNPCIDPSVFNARDRRPVDGDQPFILFCYGRPHHPRNCFEMLASALRILKRRMGSDIIIAAAGAEWSPKAHGLDGVVENLGLLNYTTTGSLYRSSDAGVSIMMTRHPSYLPMELMACGSLVITNRNSDTGWFLKDGENCLLTNPSATCLADRIEEGLRDTALRRRVTANASEIIAKSYSNWEESIARIYSYMLRQF